MVEVNFDILGKDDDQIFLPTLHDFLKDYTNKTFKVERERSQVKLTVEGILTWRRLSQLVEAIQMIMDECDMQYVVTSLKMNCL